MTKDERRKKAEDIMCLSDRESTAALCYILGYGERGDVTFDEVIDAVYNKLTYGHCKGDVYFSVFK